MNIIRNAFLAFTVFGALSLSACKTTDDSMDAPASADQSATDSSTMPPTDSSTMPPTEPTDSTTPPTTPATTP